MNIKFDFMYELNYIQNAKKSTDIRFLDKGIE